MAAKNTKARMTADDERRLRARFPYRVRSCDEETFYEFVQPPGEDLGWPYVIVAVMEFTGFDAKGDPTGRSAMRYLDPARCWRLLEGND